MISDAARDQARNAAERAQALFRRKSEAWHAEHDAPVIQAYLSGLSQKKTGREFGISDDSVRRILKRYGILRRRVQDYPCTERQRAARRENGRRAGKRSGAHSASPSHG